MPINGTDLVDEPFNTTFKPFTDLFERFLGPELGFAFFIVPISFIAIALYLKTKDPVLVSMYMIVTGVLMTAGGTFTGMGNVTILFVLFSAIGIASLFMSLIFRR